MSGARLPATGRTAGTALIACLLLVVGPGARAQMAMDSMQGGSAPADARDPHAYADGVGFTHGDQRPVLMDHHRFHSIRVDQFEITRADDGTRLPFDTEAWWGTTYDRALFRSRGYFDGDDLGAARSELLWAHAIGGFWDSRLGVRYDSGEGPGRSWLAAGISGLAPYRIALDITAYAGESSRTGLGLEAAYDMLMTQRLILEPKFEANFYGQDDAETGHGSGLSDATLALRLRYEIRREFAPYIGLEWTDQYGGTEDLSRAAGRDPSDVRLVVGIRFWL